MTLKNSCFFLFWRYGRLWSVVGCLVALFIIIYYHNHHKKTVLFKFNFWSKFKWSPFIIVTHKHYDTHGITNPRAFDICPVPVCPILRNERERDRWFRWITANGRATDGVKCIIIKSVSKKLNVRNLRSEHNKRFVITALSIVFVLV